MSVEEILSLFWTSLPYLNLAIITLDINLALKKAGLEIEEKEFKRKVLESLILGILLIFISTALSLIVQFYSSEFPPQGVFFIALLVYVMLSQMEAK